jgi:hypothetical protein
MKIARLLRLAAAALLPLLCGASLAQGLPVVPGEPARAEKQAPAAKLRLVPEAVARVRLAPVTDKDVERVRVKNAAARGTGSAHTNLKRVAIGLDRNVELEALEPVAGTLAWSAVEGGEAARLSVTSPGAAALRAALDLAAVADDVEMVFFGSAAPGRLFGPYRAGEATDRSAAWWTPMTEGETLTVEFFSPRAAAGGNPRVLEVGHLFRNPAERAGDKRLVDIGDAGSCNVDVPCSSLNGNPAFRNAMSAVAQMVFTDGGFVLLCTGTLLNDTDASTQRPWFFGANHCFDNDDPPFKTPAQMQAVANSLTTLWFFEASACGTSVPNPGWQQLGGGATYLYSNEQSDALFLRLNRDPPSGAFFSGWDPNPVGVGSATLDGHHPQGDLKKVSQGSVTGLGRWDSTSTANQYIFVQWSSGTTEGGSSGSGLLTLAGSQYLLRGGLRGGAALCSNLTGIDIFSRFDLIYPSISQYLGTVGGGGAVPFANVTSLWWVPSESGWGLNLIHRSASNIVFGTWYTYGADGKRTWFVMPTGSWTSSNTYTGALFRTSGPAFTASYDPSLVTTRPVGSGTLTFSDANNATWSYTVDGVSGVKTIQRFAF